MNKLKNNSRTDFLKVSTFVSLFITANGVVALLINLFVFFDPEKSFLNFFDISFWTSILLTLSGLNLYFTVKEKCKEFRILSLSIILLVSLSNLLKIYFPVLFGFVPDWNIYLMVSFLFVLTSCSLLISNSNGKIQKDFLIFFNNATFVLCLMVMVVSFLKLTSVTDKNTFIKTGWYLGFLFFCLNAGIIFASKTFTFFSVLVTRSAAGKLSRLLIIAAILIPFLTIEIINFLDVKGRCSPLDAQNIAIVVIISVMVLTILKVSKWFYFLELQKKEQTKKLAFHSALLKSQTDAIFSIDPEAKITSINEAGEKLYNLNEKEVLGKPIHEVLNIEFGTSGMAQAVYTVKEKATWKGELIVRLPEKAIFVSAAVSPIINEKGIVTGMVIVHHDITANKEYLHKIEESEKLFRLLSDFSLDIISRHNISADYTYISPACEKILGYEAHELLGKSPFDLLHPDDVKSIKEIQLSIISNRKKSDFVTYRIRKKDGSYTWLESGIQPILNEQGEIQEFIVSSRDVSERIKYESIITDLNSELNIKNAQLEMKYADLEAFSYSVSHDLRSPLRSLLGLSTILKEGIYKDADELVSIAKMIDKTAHKMDRLILDLLSLSKVKNAQFNKVKINMMELVERLVKENSFGTNLTFHENFLIFPLEAAFADKALLEIVINNLLQNAIKYSSKTKNPKIEIGSYLKETKVVFYIKDNGVGFSMGNYEKLFKPFSRLHNSEDFEGTGLGLTIVKRIIEKHGGKIWAASALNDGTTFYFSLPAMRDDNN